MTKHIIQELYLEQSADLIWMIDTDFRLIYANESYLNTIVKATGVEKKLNDSVFVEGFGEGYIDKWKTYYKKALSGEPFEIDEHYYDSINNETRYGQVMFNPIRDEHSKVIGVACQSRDTTRFVKERSEAKQMMDASLDVFCSINEQGNFVYISEAAQTHWGYAPEELIHTPYADLIIEEDVPKTKDVAKAVFTGTELKSFVNRYRKKDGTIAYNLWSARWDADAKLMYCVARDGKEYVEKEEILLKSEQRFKALIQEGGDMISIIDTAGRYIYTSPTTTSILGISPEEFDGRTIFDFIHPADIERSAAYMERILSESKVIVEPFRLRDGNSKWRWIETVLTNMLDNPAVNGIVANSRDVTEKIAEQHRLKLLESVITNTKDAVMITEAEPFDEPGTRILYVNDAFTKMTGYTAKEVIGKTPRILQGPNSNRDELDRLSQAIRKWKPFEMTTINYKKNGDEFWINFAVTPVADENGWFTHWIAIERDVTEQKTKELENELIAQISLAFALENDIEDAAKKLCEVIGHFGKYDWVEVCTENMEKSKMQVMGHFVATPDDEAFYETKANQKAFSRQEGSIGNVWESGQQILWDDITKNEGFARSDAAKAIGVKAILGIPLIFNNEVLGVLTVGVKHNVASLRNNTKIFQRLETFIGSELKRKLLENDLSHLFDTIPDMVTVGDFQGRFLRINKAGCDILGYREEDILYQGFESFIHPDDLDIAYKELKRLESGHTTFGFEVRFLTKSGEIIWLSWYCKASIHEGLIYTTAKNITEEKKLRELNRQTRTLAKIGSWEVDLLNQSIYWSDEVHQLHETDPTTFVPDLATAIGFYRSDFQPMVQACIDTSIRTGESFDFEAVLVTAKHNEIWVRAVGQPEFFDGKCTRIFGSFQDIHIRKEAEIRLQSLADNLPGVVFQYYLYKDGTDALRYVTKGAIDIWGFTAEETIQNNRLVWDQIAAGGQFDIVQKSIADAIEFKKNWTARWKYVMPNGEERTHLGLGTPSFLVDGTIMFHSVILDVTQEAKNEELLSEVSKIAKIGTWETDLVEGNHYKSPMVDDILELEPDESIPDMQSTIDFCRADYREKMEAHFMSCITHGKPFDFESIIVTAKKNEKWVRIIGTPKMHDGACVKIIGSLQDISSLKETETRLQAISNNLPGVVYQYLIHPDGTDEMRYISGAVEQVWGFTAEQVVADLNIVWDQIKAGGDFEESKASIAKAIETKSKWTTTIQYMKPDGELRTHLGNGMPSFLSDGTIVFNSIILDITQEAKNEQLLEQTTTIAKIGSWELNLANQNEDKMYWSPMVFEILELDKSYNPSYSGGLELHVGESKIRIQQRMDALMKTGQEFDEEVLIKTGKGADKWVRVIGKCDRVNNVVNKIYGSFQDINESKTLELQIREILGSISDAFYAVDANWNFTYFNREAENLLKKNAEQVLGKSIWKIFSPARGTALEEIYKRVASTGQSENFEYHYPGDGSWYEITAYPSNGGVSAYFKNIDERRKAAMELERAYKEKNEILESISDAFFAVDEEWIVTYWNNHAETILGRKKHEIVGNKLWDVFSDAIDSVFYRNYHKALETGETVNFEEYYPTLDMWVEVAAYPSESGLSVYFKDITLRKRADIRLLEANERFELVTKATNDTIWDWDIVNDDFYRSDNIQKLFGENASTHLKKNQFWKDKFHPEDVEKLESSIVHALNDPSLERWEMEYRVFNDNKEELSVIDRGIIVRNAKGKATRMVGAITDLTKQKKLEKELFLLNTSLVNHAKELERSNQDLEQFAFVTSHDLQEPLRMVSSFMDQLKRKYADQLDEKALLYIHYATDGAIRMKQIILDLLLYSRANRPTEQLEEVNLNDLVFEYTQLRRKLISDKKATLTHGPLPTLNTYKAPIVQVFHCLLDNALRYVRDGVPPVIEIHVKEQADVWEFAIKDNGIGINEMFYDKIFIIFQRLHNRESNDGNGIGLSIVKRCVEFLGGTIWLESTENEGTTFYFTIPKM